MGERAITSINCAKTFGLSFTGKRSRTMAMLATLAAQLPMACMKRMAIRLSMLVVKAQAMEAKMNIKSPTYNGFLRPYLSNSGPYSNCPADMPMKKLDRDNATLAVVVCIYSAITGKPGKYISMVKGPSAVNEPRIRIREIYFCLVMIIVKAIAGSLRMQRYALR